MGGSVVSQRFGALTITIATRLARAEGDLKEVEDRSAAGKTAMEKQISLQETLTTLQKDKADEAIKKIASLQVSLLLLLLLLFCRVM